MRERERERARDREKEKLIKRERVTETEQPSSLFSHMYSAVLHANLTLTQKNRNRTFSRQWDTW